jgi:acetyltransferase-like isoleucine patch superfamily enzyme
MQLQLQAWAVLYKSRFKAGRKFVRGRLFGVYFDASSSKVEIGTDVQFRDYCQIRSGMSGTLSIGDRVFFNNHCSITCFHSITIGNDCQFGEGVKFYDHNHQYKATDKPINQQGYTTGFIKIGNNCWFGSDVIILKNVEIGDHVVVGAGCIIHESIPSGSVIINKQELVKL